MGLNGKKESDRERQEHLESQHFGWHTLENEMGGKRRQSSTRRNTGTRLRKWSLSKRVPRSRHEYQNIV
jgi:hypothetical protein